MPRDLYLIITLRKKVPDKDTGETIYDLVKDRLADRPDIEVAGHMTDHFNLDT